MKPGASPSFITPPAAPSAVEVVTTLGDSVVDVSHVKPENRPRDKKVLYVLIGVAATLFVIAGHAFFQGVSLASDNAQAYHIWTQVENRPFYEFRPERMSLIYDWLAFGGLFAGLFAAVMAVVRFRAAGARSSFTIGSDRGVDLCTDVSPASSFELVRAAGDETVVCAAPAMDGEMRVDGHVRPLSALVALGLARPSAVCPGAHEITVPEKGSVHLQIGAARVAVRRAAAPSFTLAGMLARFERRMVRFLAVSAVVHLGLIALLATIPPDAHTLTLDLGGHEDRITRIKMTVDEDKIEQVEIGESGGGEDGGSAGIQGAEGQAGDPSETASGRMSINNRSDRKQLSRVDAIAMAEVAGPIGVIQAHGGFTTMATLADFSSGDGAYDIYGTMDGDEVGPGGGVFGASYRGTGPGGGSIKTGSYATMNPFGSRDGITGTCRGCTLPGRDHKPRVPDPTISKPRVNGDIDREIVRRYIRRQRDRIRYCYERELLTQPDLAGTVESSFLIDGNGAVVASTASGIGHSKVEKCVADIVKAISFPQPSGGSSVQVTYPFRFRSSG